MATLKDVAELAGVSPSTVSYVLNNKKTVSSETYKRIDEAIKKLNYRPNQLAKGLKTKKTFTIGVMVPDIDNMFFTGIIKGIEEEANKNGYAIILCNTDNNPVNEKCYLENLLAKDIDALVFVGTSEVPSILDDIGDIPTVVLDRKLESNVSTVMVDNIKGGSLAASYLLDKYGPYMGFITGPLSINTFSERMTGYTRALHRASLEINEARILQEEFTYEGGYRAAGRFLNSGALPRSIFIANDLMALGAIRALYERGVRIPEETAIVGYDDIPFAAIYIPALSTVRQPKLLLGQQAVRIIMEKIGDKRTKNIHILLEPELIIRETA